jgi:hypothetical protein
MFLRILAFSAAHFLVSLILAILAFGLDMDQLRSRSAVSRAAGVLYDFFWWPHDAFLRALPSGAILRPGVIPAVLVGHSLVWGIALYGLWRLVKRARSRPAMPS